MALGAIGAISALGSGAMSGLGTGLELYDKYADLQGQQLLMQDPEMMRLLMQGQGQGLGTLGTLAQGFPTPPPGQSSQPPSGAPPGAPEGTPPTTPVLQPGETVMGSDPMAAARAQLAAGLRERGMVQGGPGAGGGGPPPVMPGAIPPRPAGLQPPAQATSLPPVDVRPAAQREPLVSTEADVRGAQEYAQTGRGWMTMPQLAQRIEQNNPNASPLAKFKALQAASKLMNQGGQTQFNQAMQLLQLQQREEHFKKGEAHKTKMEEARIKREEQAETRLLRNSPYVRSEEKQLTQAKTNLTNTELRMDKIKGHVAQLAPIAAQVGITGNVKFDSWLREAQKRLGWTNETYAQYEIMLANLRSEIAAMSQQTLGALTVSSQEHARQLIGGVLTPGILKAIEEAVKLEGDVTKRATNEIVRRHQKNIQHYMDTKGQIPEDEEPAAVPGTTGTGTGTGAGTGGWR